MTRPYVNIGEGSWLFPEPIVVPPPAPEPTGPGPTDSWFGTDEDWLGVGADFLGVEG